MNTAHKLTAPHFGKNWRKKAHPEPPTPSDSAKRQKMSWREAWDLQGQGFDIPPDYGLPQRSREPPTSGRYNW